MSIRRVVSLGLLAVALAPWTVGSVRAQEGETALGRLQATMQAAVASGPALPLLAASMEATRAGYAAATGAGAPSLEVQREGFKGFFDNQLNSIWYLRARTPFNAPWQSSHNEALDEGVTEWQSLERRARLLEVAARAGGRWLELAAETERIELLRARVERMDRALRIQQRRYDVGEVSGSEVTQLELERLVDLAQLRQSEANSAALASAIRALLGADFPPPRQGDLAALRTSTGELPGAAAIPQAAQSSASVRAAQSRGQAERRWGELLDATVWGRPELAVEFEHIPAVGGAPGFNGWGFMLNVPLPFGRAGNERVTEALARARSYDAEARRLALDLERQLEEAASASDNAARVLEDFGPTLARAPEIQNSLADQFRLGAISYLVYIDGLTRLDEVQLQAVASRLTLLSARLHAATILDLPSIFPLPAAAPSERRP